MGRQGSPPTSNTLHQFLNPDSISSPTQIDNQHLDAFGADFRYNACHHSIRPLLSIQTHGERMSRPIDLIQVPPPANESETNRSRQLPNESGSHTQKLSLSLGSWMLLPPTQPLISNFMSPTYSCNPAVERVSNDYSFSNSSFASSLPSQYQLSPNFYGTESYMIAIGDSKYLKPAQSFLEEAVSVGEKSVPSKSFGYGTKDCN